MTMDIDSVGGELVGSARGRVLRFQAGRVCQEPGCRTRLSVYNSRTRCALHDFDATLVSFRPPPPVAAGWLPRAGDGDPGQGARPASRRSRKTAA